MNRKIGILKRILLRIVKGIQINRPENIELTESAHLCNYSILNATNGRIILQKNTRIGNSTELVSGENCKITLKDYSTTYSNCKILGDVEIERYCTLASNIYISSGNHYAFEYPELPVKMQDSIVLSTKEGKENHNHKVHIHEDVWIGNGVFISSGVTIGRGAIIGSNAVVTKDVEPYTVVAGIPAKVIKSRLNYQPPSELNCQNIATFPYFYQGFEHMNLPEITSNKGFLLLDEGLIHIQIDEKELFFEGTADSSTQLSISIENQLFNQEISAGTFKFNLQLNEEILGKIVFVKISATNCNCLYFKRINSVTN
jgi:acetyltransferase-like isoleucine patch superfamily enzyme